MLSYRVLSTERELRAYLHRTRMTLLANLREAPATVSQVAARMGVHPANLSRHMRVLEEAGLIERTPSAGGVEKFYLATALSFEVAPDSSAHRAGSAIALGLAKSDLSAAMARLDESGARVATAFLARTTVSRERAAGFAHELRALAERFKAAEQGEGEAYHLNLSIYPGGVWDGPRGPVRLEQTGED